MGCGASSTSTVAPVLLDGTLDAPSTFIDTPVQHQNKSQPDTGVFGAGFSAKPTPIIPIRRSSNNKLSRADVSDATDATGTTYPGNSSSSAGGGGGGTGVPSTSTPMSFGAARILTARNNGNSRAGGVPSHTDDANMNNNNNNSPPLPPLEELKVGTTTARIEHFIPPWCHFRSEELLISKEDTELLASSWKRALTGISRGYKLAHERENLEPATYFYNNLYHLLFELIPECKPMFHNSIRTQGTMLGTVIKFIVKSNEGTGRGSGQCGRAHFFTGVL